ncbi:MAG TPA: hypothetical protein VGJ26_02510 [Pirellulales bacterium]
MFVVVTLAAAFVAYHANWIRQRREIQYEIQDDGVPRLMALNGNHCPIAPGLLWMFGESGTEAIIIFPTGQDIDAVVKARAQRLFPESTVEIIGETPE